MSGSIGSGGRSDRRELDREFALVELLQEVSRAANDAAELVDAGRVTLGAICRVLDWPVGHLLVPAGDGSGEYASSGVWYLEYPNAFGLLRKVTSSARFIPGNDLVGQAAATGTASWSPDVTQDPGFGRALAASSLETAHGAAGTAAGGQRGAGLGVRASLAVPVQSRRAVVAVMEFFASEVVDADKRLLDVMTDVGALLGQVSDRIDDRLALQASKERLEQILETSAEAFVAMDDEGRIAGWNAAAARIFGLSRVEALGRDLIDTVVPPRHREEYRLGLQRLLVSDGQLIAASGRHRLDRRVETVAWHATGREFPVELQVSSLRGPDGRWTFHAFMHDITERRRADEALRVAYEHERAALSKLKELDDAKTNFLGTVSHELRTPLTSLAGYLELLADGDVGPITDAQRQVVETMTRNAGRLRALIEDLLIVSQMHASPLDLDLAPTDLVELVSEACTAVTDSAAERGHQLEVDIDVQVGEAFADGAQLRRVVASLLDNAIKCTPPGGRIEVRLRRAPGVTEIAVSDNGMGIDPSEVPRLFTRFFRTSAATQLAIQGAGLSLAIARQIVDGHGGSISVRTAPGAGSTFTVRLPLPESLNQAA